MMKHGKMLPIALLCLLTLACSGNHSETIDIETRLVFFSISDPDAKTSTYVYVDVMPTGLRYDGVISYREGFEYPEECQKCLDGTESCAMKDCILDVPKERLHGELPEDIFEEFQRLFDCSSRDALTRYSDIKVSDETNFDETKKRMWMSVRGTSAASGIEVTLCPWGDFHLTYGVEYSPETMALKASIEDILQRLREDSLSDK